MDINILSLKLNFSLLCGESRKKKSSFVLNIFMGENFNIFHEKCETEKFQKAHIFRLR